MRQKSIINIWIIVLFVVIHYSCGSTDPKTPETNPPGYQKDIPWPSLADSPWPMYRGDPQNTCRSKWAGPTAGVVAWEIRDTIFFQSNTITGPDSSFYFYGTGMNGLRVLYKFDLNGNIIWKSENLASSASSSVMAPFLTANNNIFLSFPIVNQLISLNTSGEILWQNNEIGVIHEGITIDKKGNYIFVGAEGSGAFKLFSMDQNGNINSSVAIPNEYFSAPSISLNTRADNAYFKVYRSLSFASYNLGTNTENWRTSGNEVISFIVPIVDSDDNIYYPGSISDSLYLMKYSEEGTVIWKYPIGEHDPYADHYQFGLDKNGNIIFASFIVGSINYKGELNWTYDLPDEETPSGPLLIDAENNIFIQSTNSAQTEDSFVRITKLNESGEKQWDIVLDTGWGFGFSMALTQDGGLIYHGYNQYMCKIL